MFLFDDLRKFVDEFPKIGGWIPCSERLPEEKINPVTNDFYEYQVTFKSDKVTDVRHYKFGRALAELRTECGQICDCMARTFGGVSWIIKKYGKM